MELYRLTLNRDSLDNICKLLCSTNDMQWGIDESDEVYFNIPKGSDVKIETFNPVKLIEKHMNELITKQKRLKIDGKRYREIDDEIYGLSIASKLISSKIYKNKPC